MAATRGLWDLSSQPGTEPRPRQWKRRFLTTRPLGSSPGWIFLQWTYLMFRKKKSCFHSHWNKPRFYSQKHNFLVSRTYKSSNTSILPLRIDHTNYWKVTSFKTNQKSLTVSALVVDVISSWETAAMTLERLFSIVTSVMLGSRL